MRNKLSRSFRVFMAAFVMVFATNLGPVATAYATTENNEETAYVESESSLTTASFWNDRTVTPDIPTKNDLCGTQNDTYTIPSTTGVNYYLDGWWLPLSSGIKDTFGSRTIKITAYPKIGYDFPSNGTYSWTLTFNGDCSVAVPSAPAVNDPCGTNNASWVVPADTAEVDWYVTGGNLFAETRSGYEFANAKTKINFGKAADSGRVCVSVPTAPAATDPCGLNNAYWTKPSDSTSVAWSIEGGRLLAAAKAGYIFDNGQLVYDFGLATDSSTPCIVSVPAAPNVTDPCGLNNATWETRVNTTQVAYMYNFAERTLEVHANDGFVFPGGIKIHSYGVAPDSDVACPPQELPLPATPEVTDPCGPRNAEWDVPANSATVTWTLQENGMLVAATTTGFVFETGLRTHSYGKAHDSNEKCPKPEKITICHATSSVKNPYREITVSQRAVDGVAGNSGNRADHFDQHDGPLFNITMQQGDDWGDIIPPIPGVHNGHNWSLAGRAIYENDCKFQQAPKVKAEKPAKTNITCEADGTYTIPSVPGVIYYVDDEAIEPGTYQVEQAGTIEITAESQEGYVLKGKSEWTLTFKAPKNCEEVTDVCPNIEGAQVTIPSELILNGEGNCVPLGGGRGAETPPAVVPTPVIPAAVFAAATGLPAQLPSTGESAWISVVIALTIMSLVLALGVSSRKQTA